MKPTHINASVNTHYLDKVMDVAEQMSVEVIVDILDVRGMKLVSKGTRVTRALREKLIAHKLMRPFEASIRITDGVDSRAVAQVAERLADVSAPVSSLLRSVPAGGNSTLQVLRQMEFGNAMALMLTASDKAGGPSLEHAVLVSMLSICMAKTLRLNEQDQMAAGLAGLLHDIGELYVDPRFLARGKRLQPHEWAHVVVHPRTGQMLIDQLESFPPSVGRAVAEHHERYDGTGYPRQVCGQQISGPGQAVAVAEMIAGLLLKDHALERAELALKIVPGEQAPELLAAVSGALRQCPHGVVAPELAAWRAGESVPGLYARIAAILNLGERLIDGPAAKSERTCKLLRATQERVRKIQRAFVSTGLDGYLQPMPFGAASDSLLLFEKDVASRELQWRLRDLARDLALQAESPDEKLVLASLINLLDNDEGIVEPQRRPPVPLHGMCPQTAADRRLMRA
ncbi:HD-GYP domain-containing protein [Pseudoduganella sp. R-43]|uniref:HD-GYP domain-containing protein n=1 Tax=unclassified Pseudoduganella TaxID=2637179 RepID=UPI003CF3F755